MEDNISDHDRLIRIDERTKYMRKNMVSRDEFIPVRRIVYGTVAAIGAMLIGTFKN